VCAIVFDCQGRTQFTNSIFNWNSQKFVVVVVVVDYVVVVVVNVANFTIQF